MKRTFFPYETKNSSIFKIIRRPIAEVGFWSIKRKKWLKYTMIVDTGADYTILPMKAAFDLSIDIEKECSKYSTKGVGGTENVYFYNKNIPIKISDFEAQIPIGFLERDDIPPILGRHKCLDLFAVHFVKFITSFGKLNK